MPLDLQDTIAAIASPPGSAKRGIIRVSGDDAAGIAEQLFTADERAAAWQNSRLPVRVVGELVIPSLSAPLPAALMLWPTSRSYTGQPMAEFHTIGSPPILDATLEHILNCGARSANRGEFTFRAFMSGKIDLVQAEAVLGVIDAADHEELQVALTQLGGGITSKLVAVRSEILALLGDLEAGLDFVEEDIEFITKQQICERLAECIVRLQQLTDDSAARLPSGYRRRIVLAGLPNAGKSTLFNRLVGAGRAIVSSTPGTTRDYLTSVVGIGDMEVEVIDTAGWETAADLIMQHAQNLRAEQLAVSDLVLWCTAADLDESEVTQNIRLRTEADATGVALLDVVTRCDLANVRDVTAAVVFPNSCRVSAQTGDGVEPLIDKLQHRLAGEQSSRSELLSSTSLRCHECLVGATKAIQTAIYTAEANAGDEVIALELRDALRQLRTVLGEVYTDDILDHIFSNFCIGK
jgi:tRNA modification GTPase